MYICIYFYLFIYLLKLYIYIYIFFFIIYISYMEAELSLRVAIKLLCEDRYMRNAYTVRICLGRFFLDPCGDYRYSPPFLS